MPEILFGVIIGGLIVSITPIFSIILDHRRWQRQDAMIFGGYLQKLRSCATGKMSQFSADSKFFVITSTNHKFAHFCDIL